MERPKHIGVDAFFAERDRLLSDYDKARKQTSDDAVKTAHGNVAESLTRRWLSSFLPKRFGVCKGFMITTNLSFEGPLDEWDILIYDAIESPVSYTREGADGEQRRAIPVEHVRAVIEVKATLTPSMAKLATGKLAMLRQYCGINSDSAYPQYLTHPFVCAAVFFETRLNNPSEYGRALKELTRIYQERPIIPLMGALVLRSQRNPDHSACLEPLWGNATTDFPNLPDMSSRFAVPNGPYGVFGTLEPIPKPL